MVMQEKAELVTWLSG